MWLYLVVIPDDGSKRASSYVMGLPLAVCVCHNINVLPVNKILLQNTRYTSQYEYPVWILTTNVTKIILGDLGKLLFLNSIISKGTCYDKNACLKQIKKTHNIEVFPEYLQKCTKINALTAQDTMSPRQITFLMMRSSSAVLNQPSL